MHCLKNPNYALKNGIQFLSEIKYVLSCLSSQRFLSNRPYLMYSSIILPNGFFFGGGLCVLAKPWTSMTVEHQAALYGTIVESRSLDQSNNLQTVDMYLKNFNLGRIPETTGEIFDYVVNLMRVLGPFIQPGHK